MPNSTQFNPQPFGSVISTTPGTPVQVAINLPGLGVMANSVDPKTEFLNDVVPCNKINFNVNPLAHGGAGNTGSIYIGIAGMNKATLVGVIFVVSPSQGGVQITNNVGMNTYMVQGFFMDVDVAGDGIYGSFDQV